MVYLSQDAYYEAIATSTREGQSDPFIDFMLGEILQALKASFTGNVPDKVPNKSELALRKLLSAHPQLTRAEMASEIRLSANGVKRIIASMKAAGWIERIGGNKSGYWIVSKEI